MGQLKKNENNREREKIRSIICVGEIKSKLMKYLSISAQTHNTNTQNRVT